MIWFSGGEFFALLRSTVRTKRLDITDDMTVNQNKYSYLIRRFHSLK